MSFEPLKFQNKYRIASARLPFHDYGSRADYFATICTQNKEPWFGEIRNGIMCLSDMGQVAYKCWESILDHFDFVHLGEFIIMPDHMHGIIEINKPDLHNDRVQFAGRVETYNYTSLHQTGSEPNLTNNLFDKY